MRTARPTTLWARSDPRALRRASNRPPCMTEERYATHELRASSHPRRRLRPRPLRTHRRRALPRGQLGWRRETHTRALGTRRLRGAQGASLRPDRHRSHSDSRTITTHGTLRTPARQTAQARHGRSVPHAREAPRTTRAAHRLGVSLRNQGDPRERPQLCWPLALCVSRAGDTSFPNSARPHSSPSSERSPEARRDLVAQLVRIHGRSYRRTSQLHGTAPRGLRGSRRGWHKRDRHPPSAVCRLEPRQRSQ